MVGKILREAKLYGADLVAVTTAGKCGVTRPATAVVLRALRDRLTRDGAEQVAAQLPQPLKEVWALGDRPGRQPLEIRRDEFLQRVKHEAGLLSGEAARRLTEAVFAALKIQVSPGEAEDVIAQLPKDLKTLWTAGGERNGRRTDPSRPRWSPPAWIARAWHAAA